MDSKEQGLDFGSMWQFYHQAERRPRQIGAMGLDLGEQMHIYDLVDRMEEGDSTAHEMLLYKYIELAAQAKISFDRIYPTNPLYDPDVRMPPRMREKALTAFQSMGRLLEHKGYVFVTDEQTGGCWLERIDNDTPQ